MSKLIKAAAEGFKDSVKLSGDLVKGVGATVKHFVKDSDRALRDRSSRNGTTIQGRDPSPPREKT